MSAKIQFSNYEHYEQVGEGLKRSPRTKLPQRLLCGKYIFIQINLKRNKNKIHVDATENWFS